MIEIDDEALQLVQKDIDEIDKAAEKVELELANKRVQLMAPIYQKRRAVLAKIPKFWPVVLQNHPMLSQITEAGDQPLLEHLTDIWIKFDPKDCRNFSIVFTFSDNDYFTNKELVKKVFVKGDESVTEKYKIDWKNGKDLTAKDSNKRKKDEDDMSDSFFSWFSDEDVSIAEIFASEIFPDALHLYVGGGDDEFDFDGQSDEDDEGSVDLSDEEDEEPTKKKSKK